MAIKDWFKPKAETEGEGEGMLGVGLPLCPPDEATSKFLRTLGESLVVNEARKRRSQHEVEVQVEQVRDMLRRWGIGHPTFVEVYKFVTQKATCPFDGDQTLEMVQTFCTVLGIARMLDVMKAEQGGALDTQTIEELIKKNGVN